MDKPDSSRPFMPIHATVAFFIFFSLAIGTIPVFALVEEQVDCSETAGKHATSLAELIRNEKYEEMPAAISLWEQECGMSEPVFRVKALLKIHQRVFPGELSNQNMIEQAVAFEIRENLLKSERGLSRQEYFDLYPGFFGFVPPGHVFDIQTQQWAGKLQEDVAKESFSYLFLQLYEGQTETFFNALKEGYFQETDLAFDYRAKVAENLALPEFNLGVNSGIWVPSGALEIVGVHPSIGIKLGVKTKNTFVDAVFEFRFGKTRDNVFITVRDTLVPTRNYQGGYGGIELTQIFYRMPSGALEIFAGAGYDIIDIVEDDRNPEKKTFGSPAIHLGLGYRFYFRNRTWLSIKPGFYFLNHKHSSGSSLAGNAFNLRLAFGFSENARKSTNLKRLGLQQWW